MAKQIAARTITLGDAEVIKDQGIISGSRIHMTVPAEFLPVGKTRQVVAPVHNAVEAVMEWCRTPVLA